MPRHHSPMPAEPNPRAASTLGQLWTLAWPPLRAEDSDATRRKKLGIRGLNGVLIGMVCISTAVLLAELNRSSQWWRVAIFAMGASLYLAWALIGITPVTSLVLRQGEGLRDAHWPARAWPNSGVFFAGEILIALGIIFVAVPINPAGVLRVFLFPILAHAVIFLRWRATALIAIVCAAIYAAFLTQPPAGGGPIGFLIEGTFTVVCMHMVVSSQKGRAEIERMATELAAANRHLGEYAAQAEELAAARERNRIAREIHDSLGHYLTVARVQLEAAVAMHDRNAEVARDAVQKAQALVGEGLREIRNSIAALRASPLERHTLCEALLALVTESEAAGMRVKMEVQGTERELSAATGLALYRAAQEGLTNVRKHAAGADARLVIDFAGRENVRLVVSDKGPGSESTHGGFGLLGLRERAALLGGKFSTETSPGQGFSLSIELPE